MGWKKLYSSRISHSIRSMENFILSIFLRLFPIPLSLSLSVFFFFHSLLCSTISYISILHNALRNILYNKKNRKFDIERWNFLVKRTTFATDSLPQSLLSHLLFSAFVRDCNIMEYNACTISNRIDDKKNVTNILHKISKSAWIQWSSFGELSISSPRKCLQLNTITGRFLRFSKWIWSFQGCMISRINIRNELYCC